MPRCHLSLLLAAIVTAPLLRHGYAHSCSDGSSVTCMAVHSLPGAHAVGERSYPFCTPGGEKVLCLVNHTYHRCGTGEEPCCQDGSDPFHEAGGGRRRNSNSLGSICSKLQTTGGTTARPESVTFTLYKEDSWCNSWGNKFRTKNIWRGNVDRGGESLGNENEQSISECAAAVAADTDCGQTFYAQLGVCECVRQDDVCNPYSSSEGNSIYRIGEASATPPPTEKMKAAAFTLYKEDSWCVSWGSFFTTKTLWGEKSGIGGERLGDGNRSISECAAAVAADTDCGQKFYAQSGVCECVRHGDVCNVIASTAGNSIYRVVVGEENTYASLGNGFCRGTSSTDNPCQQSRSDMAQWCTQHDPYNGVESDCQALCTASSNCLAYEFGLNQCELWTRLPQATGQYPIPSHNSSHPVHDQSFVCKIKQEATAITAATPTTATSTATTATLATTANINSMVGMTTVASTGNVATTATATTEPKSISTVEVTTVDAIVTASKMATSTTSATKIPITTLGMTATTTTTTRTTSTTTAATRATTANNNSVVTMTTVAATSSVVTTTTATTAAKRIYAVELTMMATTATTSTMPSSATSATKSSFATLNTVATTTTTTTKTLEADIQAESKKIMSLVASNPRADVKSMTKGAHGYKIGVLTLGARSDAGSDDVLRGKLKEHEWIIQTVIEDKLGSSQVDILRLDVARGRRLQASGNNVFEIHFKSHGFSISMSEANTGLKPALQDAFVAADVDVIVAFASLRWTFSDTSADGQRNEDNVFSTSVIVGLVLAALLTVVACGIFAKILLRKPAENLNIVNMDAVENPPDEEKVAGFESDEAAEQFATNTPAITFGLAQMYGQEKAVGIDVEKAIETNFGQTQWEDNCGGNWEGRWGENWNESWEKQPEENWEIRSSSTGEGATMSQTSGGETTSESQTNNGWPTTEGTVQANGFEGNV